MSGVKRYEFEVDDRYLCDCGNGSRIIPVAIDTGKYVLASDYDRDTQALRAEIERYIQEGIKIADQRDELRAQVEAMKYALNHILAMQTRGFITLGDNATSMANAALKAKP